MFESHLGIYLTAFYHVIQSNTFLDWLIMQHLFTIMNNLCFGVILLLPVAAKATALTDYMLPDSNGHVEVIIVLLFYIK